MFYDSAGAPVRKSYTLDEFGVDTTAAMGAAFKQSLLETFSSATWRDNELIRANIGEDEVHYGAYSPSLGHSKIITGTEKKLTTEQAQAQINDSGLPLTVPDEGFTQKALDIVMNRKREELVRKKQMDDASGFIATGGKFAASMIAQVLDPVNVAVSFVPVIGPTKYAAWIASAAGAGERALIRAGVGTVEGLAGAAIVEPAIYQAMSREQADYTMADSLINVGLGTVLGGGLHMGIGAASDAFKRTGSKTLQQPQGTMSKAIDSADPATREAMLKTSMQMEAQGYKLDVTAVAAADPNLNAITKAMEAESKATGIWFHGTSKEFDRFDISTFGANEPRGDYVGKAIFFTQSKEKAQRYAKQSGGDIIKTAELDLKNPLIIKDGAPKDYYDAINPSKHLDESEVQYMRDAGMSEREIKQAAFYDLTEIEKADYAKSKGHDGLIDYDYGQAAVFDGEQVRIVKEKTPMPPHVDESQAAKNTVSEGFSPGNKRGVDKPASIEADAKLAKTESSLDEEMSDLEDFFSEYQKMTGDDTSLKIYDEAIAKAETDATALKAATMCRLTK